MGNGEESQFEAGGDAGFVEDVGEVTLDGFFADSELLGDVLVAAAFDDAGDDFEFAWGEAVGLALGCGGGLLHEGVERGDEIDDALSTDPVVAGEDGAQGAREVAGKCVLEDDAPGADLQGFDDLLGGDGAGEHDDLDARGLVHDGAQGFEAGQTGHREIEQENVGLELEGLGDGDVAVLGLADDFEAGLVLEHVFYAEANDGMIVGDHDANWRGGYAYFVRLFGCFLHRASSPETPVDDWSRVRPAYAADAGPLRGIP